LNIEPHKIFRELDVNGSGEITLDDLLMEHDAGPKRPTSSWWRMLIVDNWGSPNSVMLFPPLRIYSAASNEAEDEHVIKDEWQEQTLFMEGMVEAHAQYFHSTPQTRWARRLANQYDVPYDEVQEIYSQFQKNDIDSSGHIERNEFEQIVMDLYELGGRGELPASRLEFFWRQADDDDSGEIDFEEFVLWYARKSPLRKGDSNQVLQEADKGPQDVRRRASTVAGEERHRREQQAASKARTLPLQVV
jgi:Ca2+-binding EF-hand superfamily protein